MSLEPFAQAGEKPALSSNYARVRALTEQLASPLSAEDQCAQSMPDASPTKWHRAHSTWFFETIILRPLGLEGLSPPGFSTLFNSYYNSIGDQYHRPSRGMLTRPSAAEVETYRRRIDDAVATLFASGVSPDTEQLIELGLHHEQQHQELMLTDIKHLLSLNPLKPVYREQSTPKGQRPKSGSPDWQEHPGGIVEIGHRGVAFAYDNERPRHRVFVQPFLMRDGLVTNAEYLQFIADGGYERPAFWLSAGWDAIQAEGAGAPLYWSGEGTRPSVFTLHGQESLRGDDPVTHVSYFEADAFARWAGARLPTEQEWETWAPNPPAVALGDTHAGIHPRAGVPGHDAYGACWQWTSSSYAPYPGYRAEAGAVGEYNGKFMCGQYVLRGSSCATSPGHARRTYRNFFPPNARWQFTGIRLARDV